MGIEVERKPSGDKYGFEVCKSPQDKEQTRFVYYAKNKNYLRIFRYLHFRKIPGLNERGRQPYQCS